VATGGFREGSIMSVWTHDSMLMERKSSCMVESVSGLKPGRRTWVGVNNFHVKTNTDEANHLLGDDR
jgi:hypothetical protein